MNPREAAVRAAVLKALRDRIDAAWSETKRVCLEVMDVADRKSAVLADGTDVGTVSVARPRRSARVGDPEAFTAWVQANRPEEIVPAVRESFTRAVLERCKADGAAVDRASGELIPGVEVGVGEPFVSVRMSDTQREAVGLAWAEGRLADVLDPVIRRELP